MVPGTSLDFRCIKGLISSSPVHACCFDCMQERLSSAFWNVYGALGLSEYAFIAYEEVCVRYYDGAECVLRCFTVKRDNSTLTPCLSRAEHRLYTSKQPRCKFAHRHHDMSYGELSIDVSAGLLHKRGG